MKRYQAAIIGYGNIGRFLVDAIETAPDFQLAGVVRRPESVQKSAAQLTGIPVVTSLTELDTVDVAFLALPSRLVPKAAAEILAMGINTVDSYDIHSDLVNYRQQLEPIAKTHGKTAVIAAGWDPGTDSLIRCLFQFMTPQGITYTNFGPGMSMGHSTAVKAIPGVLDALSLTIPVGTGLHRRMVYVKLAPEADPEVVEQAIKQDPYFVHDETVVTFVPEVQGLIDMGHGVLLERKGASGRTHNQLLKFEMRINNPALTAQVMVAAARAGLKQQPGCYTMIEIPVIDYLYGEREELIASLV
ncbi:MAG TPA: diaminopimelate dehydrogenase [Firmicutes bacterium]|uniref:Meso-diaminopimelate D-dehydrogenase n=1 Tax=Capillibacterium thermochitinicola TaxID=2699427 RepID=A0A8J6I374_9FIRM|nr:diaminopimelate dehydrogenase [Capillibacterium thermochitinicola]MBA2133839.1 diaminopimelate dehydrogenase [Capillibacterium thermochitinicola]HHW11634.1 diaminopimelate dehydrogenase [Bacillota bacterium]